MGLSSFSSPFQFSIYPLDPVVEEDVAVLRDGLGLAALLLLVGGGRVGLAAVVAEVRQVAALEEERVGHAHLLAGRRQPGALVHGVVAVVLLRGVLILGVVVLGADQVVGHLLGGTGHDGGGVRREERGGHRVGRRSPGRGCSVLQDQLPVEEGLKRDFSISHFSPPDLISYSFMMFFQQIRTLRLRR